ncbi:MAG: hypothetical protein R3343_14800 [Nitriliruptorales bacterium]|nr:hypothetical protein [Nitriliruptorales bacterium]
MEGWWQAVPGSASPDVGGKIEREIVAGGDELDALVRGIDAPKGSVVEVVFDGDVVASAALERKRRLFAGATGRVRITVDATARPRMRAGDRVVLRINGEAVAEAVLEPD